VKVQAEMGGKNSAIVLADTDVDWAVDQIISAAMLQSGQRCTATSRALVSRDVFDEVLTLLVARAEELVVGDGLDPASDLGPVVSRARRDEILDYVAVATASGASLLTSSPDAQHGGGFFVRPTVLSDVEPDAAIFREEVFGPVLAVVPFDDPEEALALANHGDYGLAGAMFTNDLRQAMAAIDRFEVGVLHINSESCGADPHVPFGGIKDSGTSQREMGTTALDFFSETKTVYFRPGPSPSTNGSR
jgi:aldehyde dehydrogenase (NAD+)